jgi:hypothetical protein
MVDSALIEGWVPESWGDSLPVIYHIENCLVVQLSFKLSEFSGQIISSRVRVLDACNVQFLNSNLYLPLICLSLQISLPFSGIPFE